MYVVKDLVPDMSNFYRQVWMLLLNDLLMTCVQLLALSADMRARARVCVCGFLPLQYKSIDPWLKTDGPTADGKEYLQSKVR